MEEREWEKGKWTILGKKGRKKNLIKNIGVFLPTKKLQQIPWDVLGSDPAAEPKPQGEQGRWDACSLPGHGTSAGAEGRVGAGREVERCASRNPVT